MIKKSELKNGDKVYYRNGAYRIVKDDTLLDESNIICHYLHNYNEELKYNNSLSDLDIVKVERLVVFENKEILDKKEKKYLSNIIKPFKNKIKNILKRNIRETQEYIAIIFYDGIDNFSLPCFDENTMYKNMELNTYYTLKDLYL